MTARKRYLPAIAGLGVFVLSGATAVGVANADSSPAGDGTSVVIDAPVTVQSYSAADFAAEAKKLPAGLTAALQRDLGVSAAEYLANAAAAKNASDIQDALEAQGVDVLQTALTEDGVTINVASAADVAAVEATGAKAVVGAPEDKKPAPEVPVAPAADRVGGLGTAYATDAVADGWTSTCSSGFNGYSTTGAPLNLSAGHCGYGGVNEVWYQPESSPRNTAYEGGSLDGYNSAPTTKLGDVIDMSRRIADGSQADAELIAYVPSETGLPRVSAWGGGDGADTDGTVDVLGSISAVVGAPICKSGATTGWTCGVITAADVIITMAGSGSMPSNELYSIISTMCMIPGDSGGAALSGNYALGLDSVSSYAAPRNDGGAWLPAGARACDRTAQAAHMADTAHAKGLWTDRTRDQIYEMIMADPDRYIFSGVFAVNSGPVSAKTLYGDEFQLAVVVSDPVVTSPALVPMTGATLSGTLANATADHAVTVVIDSDPAITVPVDAGGNWSAALPALTEGMHDYTVTGVYGAGQYSKSASVTGTIEAVNVAPLVITSPADGTVLSDARTPIVGTGHVGATVALSVGSTDFGSTMVAADGSFTLTPSADLPYGRFNVTVTHAIASPAITTSATIANVGRTPPAPTVTSAATLKPGATVAGNGLAGATIAVSLAGPKAITGSATVAADGTWTWVLPSDTPMGTYTMGVTQTVADLTSAATNSVLTVSATGGSGGLPNTGFGSEPFMIGLIAIALGGLAVAGVGLARRRHATR